MFPLSASRLYAANAPPSDALPSRRRLPVSWKIRGCVLVGGYCLVKLAHALQCGAKVEQRAAFTVLIAGLPEDRGGIFEQVDRLFKLADRYHCPAEIGQCHAFAVPVANLPEDRGCILVRGNRFLNPTYAL